MKRREFLKTAMLAVGAASAPFYPLNRQANAAAQRKLQITTRTIEIGNKPAKVYGLTGPDGKAGLTLSAGDRFSVSLENRLQEETLIHWHGLIPPWEQDGVPDNPAPLLKAGETRDYDFPLHHSGTFWMHAHTLQEQNLLAAPLIIRSKEDLAADMQEVVILLHDFSFTPAEELLSQLSNGSGSGSTHMHGMNHTSMGAMDMSSMQMGAMDLNDIDYDAYLANDRTFDDPEVIRVEKGGKVRLRIINGATSTGFHISTGALASQMIAADGHTILPVRAKSYPLSMGQRADILIDIPAGGGAFPLFARREGTKDQTGIMLATANAKIGKIENKSGVGAPPIDLQLEANLSAVASLPVRPADRQIMLHLQGTMSPYEWSILNGDMLVANSGERLEVSMMNMSMMSHPMHLHGHVFQVVGINGKPLSGAVRDTVNIPPMQTVTVAFDAGAAGQWPFHCHHLYHMATGMMAHMKVV